jgi:nitrate reductase NapE component
MDKITKKEKKELLRFLVLLLVIGAILVVMCLVLGYVASKLPVGSGGD